MAKNTFNLSAYATRNPNGTIDVAATQTQFSADLATLIKEEKEDQKILGDAIVAAFAKSAERGAVEAVRMETVIHYALEVLNVAPEHHSELRKRVQDFIRSNPQRFPISKGKNGGVKMAGHAAPATQSAPPSQRSLPPSARLSNAPSAPPKHA